MSARPLIRALAKQLKDSGYSAPARKAVMNGDADAVSRRVAQSSGPWYHGTIDRDFDAFDPHLSPRRHGTGSAAGVFFTNSLPQGHNFRRLALKYSPTARDKSDGRVIEAIIRGRYKEVDVPALERKRSSRRTENPYALGLQKDWMLHETAAARREGYDGVDFVNISDDPLSSKHRATHRVVFPDRVAKNVDILHSHILPPAGVMETTIEQARIERAANKLVRAPKKPMRAARVKFSTGPF